MMAIKLNKETRDTDEKNYVGTAERSVAGRHNHFFIIMEKFKVSFAMNVGRYYEGWKCNTS